MSHPSTRPMGAVLREEAYRPDFAYIEKLCKEEGRARSLSRSPHYGIDHWVAGERISKTECQIDDALAICESPIERIMLPALAFACYGDKFASFPAEVHLSRNSSPPPLGDVVIVPQFAFIRYRLDFAVIGAVKDNRIIVGVECDGDDYHLDADKDRRRDAYLAGFGIKVFHFSGSEIVHDPYLGSGQVAQFVASWRETIA